MNRTIRFTLIAGLLALGAALAGAGEPLSLEQARSAALARSATLRKALLAVDASQLQEKIQGYARLPSISASAGAGASYPSTSLPDSLGASVSVNVSQTLYAGDGNAVLSAIDAIATQAAREQARSEYLGVVQAVDAAYYAVLEAQASVGAARSDLEAAQTHLALARARLEAGMITRFALLQSEAQEAARQTALAQAEGTRSVAESRLASLTGLTPPFSLAEADLGVPGALDQLAQRLAGMGTDAIARLVEGATSAAAANNPSLARARLAGRQAALSVDLASADYLPSVSASYRHTLSGRVGQPSETQAGEGSLSLSASIPLDVWKTKANVQARKTVVEQAQSDLQEASRSLELDIRAAVYDCLSSARSSTSAAKALEYAEGYYQSVLELYRLGSASSPELSDAQALVSTNRTALIRARYGLLTQLSSLSTLAGLETDQALTDLIP